MSGSRWSAQWTNDLDAGGARQTLIGEDNVVAFQCMATPVVCAGEVPRAPRLTLARERQLLRSVTRGLMGCPEAGLARPFDLLRVVQLQLANNGTLGTGRACPWKGPRWWAGSRARHRHRSDGGEVDPGLIAEGPQSMVTAAGELSRNRELRAATADLVREPQVVQVVGAGLLAGMHCRFI